MDIFYVLLHMMDIYIFAHDIYLHITKTGLSSFIFHVKCLTIDIIFIIPYNIYGVIMPSISTPSIAMPSISTTN